MTRHGTGTGFDHGMAAHIEMIASAFASARRKVRYSAQGAVPCKGRATPHPKATVTTNPANAGNSRNQRVRHETNAANARW
jgi:hypothetical protein